MMFNFELKPPLKCAGLEMPEKSDSYVCWFYLTDSKYFIDFGETKLFQLSVQWLEKYKDEYPSDAQFEEYQYSRLLEDLFDILPTIACPMPSDLYALVETDEKRDLLRDVIEDVWETENLDGTPWNETDEKYDNISRHLLYYGGLDSGYLRVRADCQFFNVDGTVFIRYNFIDEDEGGCPVWSANKGIYTLPYEKFICEIDDLLNRFFSAMDRQVEAAMQIFSEETIKKHNLISEHAERKKYFYGILESLKNNVYEKQIDWKKLRSDLDYFQKQNI